MDLKSKIRHADNLMLGAFLGIPSPPLVEMLGHAGYDFAIIDAEHGTFNIERLEDCVRAANAANISCLVRVPCVEPQFIQEAFDIGADGVQVPQVETATQAQMAVQSSLFPPYGTRGFGATTRAAGYGFRPRSQMTEQRQRELVVVIQIESQPGVKNLKKILETEGVDVVFIGTSDLSMAYGYSTPSDPAMFPLLEMIIAAIVSAGKIPGIHITDWRKIDHLQQLGVRYFTLSATALIKEAMAKPVKDFAAIKNSHPCNQPDENRSGKKEHNSWRL